MQQHVVSSCIDLSRLTIEIYLEEKYQFSLFSLLHMRKGMLVNICFKYSALVHGHSNNSLFREEN